jgi:hypothetical protein
VLVGVGMWMLLSSSLWVRLVRPSISAGLYSSLPWACAAIVMLVSGRRPSVGRVHTASASLASSNRRLTPDRAFSAIAVLVAMISAWFSYQANEFQQDVRVRAQADQLLLVRQAANADAFPSANYAWQGDSDIVVQNHSRLPVRNIKIVTVSPDSLELNAIIIDALQSCEQVWLERSEILRVYAGPQDQLAEGIQIFVVFEDVSGNTWERHLTGPPTATSILLSGTVSGPGKVRRSPR